MKRGQVFVRAISPSGKWHSADVLDLDDRSLHILALEKLRQAQLLICIRDDLVEGEHIPLRSTKEPEE